VDQLEELRRYLTVKTADSYFNREPGWTNSIKFFDARSQTFPYGLWGHVKFFLKDNEIKHKIVSHRKPLPLLDSKKLGDVKLYGLQVRSCNAWFKNGGNGIIWGAGGFGKTEIACAIMNQMLKRGYANKILFVVNGLDLQDQAILRIKLRLRLNAGRISGGDKKNVVLNKIITVGAIQKLHSMIKKKDPRIIKLLNEVDFIVYDETHHSRSHQTTMLIKNCPAKYRLGISARPLRISYDDYKTKDLNVMKADDARVMAIIGPVVKRVTPSQLIKLGRLARPRIYLYPLNYKDFRSPLSRMERLAWPKAKRELIIENEVIHRVACLQAVAAARANQTTMVIAGGSRKLGLNVYQRMQDANLNVVYLHGGVDKGFRSKSRLKMNMNKLEACVATTIYDEGIDIPNLRQLVLAFGGLSPIKNEQRLARGVRVKKGVNEAVVIDFMNYGNKHVRKHSYARLKLYLEEKRYKMFLVGKDHPPYVIRLVGKDRIVKKLPGTKLFRRLGRGRKHT